MFFLLCIHSTKQTYESLCFVCYESSQDSCKYTHVYIAPHARAQMHTRIIHIRTDASINHNI